MQLLWSSRESFNLSDDYLIRGNTSDGLDSVEKYGDDADETADLYFSYGKALLENAISQSAVLGKDQTENSLVKDEANGDGEPSRASELVF